MKISVRKRIAIGLLAMLSASVSAQEFYVTGFGGVSSLYAPSAGMLWRPGLGGSFGGGCHIYLGKRFFLGLGPELSYLNSGLTADRLLDADNSIDIENEPFVFRYALSHVNERHTTFMLHIPLTANLLIGSHRQWYASVGARIGVPFNSRYALSIASMEAIGDYSQTHGHSNIDGPTFAGFGRFDNLKNSGNLALSTSVEATLEFGYRLQLTGSSSLMVGLYFDYGLNHINADKRRDVAPVAYTTEQPAEYIPNSFLASSDGRGKAYNSHLSPVGTGLRLKWAFGNIRSGSTRSGASDNAATSILPLRDTVWLASPVVYDTIYLTPDGNMIANRQLFETNQNQTTDLNQQATSSQLTIGTGGTVGTIVTIPSTYFEFGEAGLTPLSRGALLQIVEWLKSNPGIKVEIGGHTDSKGNDSFNNRLSLSRAKAVYDYLRSYGIDTHRMTFKGYGASKPIADNNSEEGRAMNRRVEIVVE